jgi:hypothetical protein
MILNQQCKTRSSKLGYRNITHNLSTNSIIFDKYDGHPLVLCGMMTPNELTKLGINSSEDYCIVSQVTHKYNPKFYINIQNSIPNFKINEDLGSCQMNMVFQLIPKSILLQGMDDSPVFLRDSGINLNQEEKCLDAVNDRIINGTILPIEIYNTNVKGNWEERKVNYSDLKLFETMEEKRYGFHQLTGNQYTETGVKISGNITGPIIGSLALLPEESNLPVSRIDHSDI